MSSGTSWNKDAINKAADNIGNLVYDRQKDFDALVNHWPDAGIFSTAQWLERRVDDRRNAIVEHAARMDRVLGDMRDTLKDIAKNFDNTDAGNASALQDFNSMKGDIDGEVHDMDINIESTQHNFSDNGKDQAVNNGDGNGYDQNLNDPIAPNPHPGTTNYHTPGPPGPNDPKPTTGPAPFPPDKNRVLQQLNARSGGSFTIDQLGEATDQDIAQAMGYDVDASASPDLTPDEQAAVDQWRLDNNIPASGGGGGSGSDGGPSSYSSYGAY